MNYNSDKNLDSIVEINSLANEIDMLVVKLSKLVSTIKALDNSIDNPRQDEFIKYNHSLMIIDEIRDYENLIEQLEAKLLLYKDLEGDNINFSYRRLLNTLRKL